MRVKAVIQINFMIDLLFKDVRKEVLCEEWTAEGAWRQAKAKGQAPFILTLYLYLFVFLVGALICTHRPGAVGSPRLTAHRLAVIIPS